MVAEQNANGKKGRAQRAILTGVTTNVLILGMVSLLTDVSSEMIYPILPLFITSIGGTALIVGLIEGASETTASLVKVISGWYSDRYSRRKPFITAGYSLSAAVKPVMALATAPWQVLGLRIAERVGKGIRSAPRDALIADSTDEQYRGVAFGFHKAMDSTGAVLGPLLILPVLLAAATVTTDTYRTIFLLSTIPAFVAVLVVILFVRDQEAILAAKVGSFFREIAHLGRPFYLLLVIVTTFYVGEISYAFFILRAYDEGISIDNLDPTISTVILYVFYNLVFVLVAIPAGKMSDRIGRRRVIAFSFVLFMATCLIMMIANTLWMLFMGFVLFGVYKGSSEGVFKAYVTDVAPSNLRGTALGAFFTAVGLVMLPGGIIAGYLWDAVGPQATFAYGIVMALGALVLLLAIGPRGERELRSA